MTLTALAFCAFVATASLEEDAPPVDQNAAATEPAGEDRLGRVAAELGAALLGLALPNILWAPFFAAQSSTCCGTSTAFVVMAGVAMLLEPLSLCTSVWLVHRKMGGRGLWPSAFGGGLLGIALGAGLTGVVTFITTQGVQNRSSTYIPVAAVGGVLLAMVATVFMIELHHDQTIAVNAAPLPGGGAFGSISGRF